MSEFDPFAGSTGLPDDFDMVVKTAWFEFDPEFNNGQTLLMKMEVETSDPDFGEGGTGELRFSCGKGWETMDKGETATREDGTNKLFHQSTAYQMFIKGAISCDGAEKVLRGEGRGDPRIASMWVGTAWHMNAKTIDYGVIDGQQIGEKQKLVPSSFLGEGTTLASVGSGGSGGGPAKAAGVKKVAPVAKAAPAKAAAPVKKATKAVAAPAAAVNGTGLTEGSPLWDSLYAVAMESDDHASFVERAFNEVEGVASDDAVGQAVMDDGDGSVWAKAVADFEAANA